MPGTSIEIKGRVIDNKTLLGIQSCSVELWKQLINSNSDPVQITESNTVVSDSTGNFVITETVDNIENYSFFVKVFKSGLLIKSTQNEPFSQLNAAAYDVTIEKISDNKTRTIAGKVIDANGDGISGRLVKAYMRTFNAETEIGNDTSSAIENHIGEYSITYDFDEIDENDVFIADNSLNIVVKLYNNPTPPDSPVVVVTSPVLYNVISDITIDISDGETLYKGVSTTKKFATSILSKIENEIANSSANNVINSDILSTLTPDDVKYLSKKTGIEVAEVSKYLQAVNFAHTFDSTNVSEERIEMIYALIKSGYDSPEKIIFASDDKLKAVIQKSSDDNAISSYINDDKQQLIVDLRSGLKDALIADTESDLCKVFEAIGFTSANEKETLIDTIVDFYNLEDQSATSVYAQLSLKTHDVPQVITQAQVDKLKLVLDVSHILDNLELSCDLIKDGYTFDNTTNYITSVNNLIDVLIKPNVRDSVFAVITEDEDEQGRIISNLEEAVPHVCFNKKLQYDNDAIFEPSESNIKINTFLTNNPEFDLGKNIVEQFNEGIEEGLLNPTQIDLLKEVELPKLQRLFNIAPGTNKYEVIKSLYTAEIYSASTIANMGEDNFISDFGEVFGDIEEQETIDKARMVFHNALMQSAKATMLWTRYGKDFNTITTNVFNSYNASNLENDIPDFAKLFGMVDYCNCSKCRSVLSPAAYLTDLLAFLKEIKVPNSGDTLLDRLFDRRPDLGEILLDCNNSNTPLPIIDLVNEILLYAVSGELPLGNQTTYNAETLLAIPEHDNEIGMADAYDIIKGANYPWSLPFDYHLEENRNYCKQLGVSKHKLMETFYLKSESSYEPHVQVNIAAEYLGFSLSEKNEIVNSHTEEELSDLYGSDIWPENATYASLNNVKMLLDYSQISYETLNKLLQSYYVNPGTSNRIKIIFTGDEGTFHLIDAFLATYNPNTLQDEYIVSTILKSFLERLYKFLKIQNKLGLSVKELDLIINTYYSIYDANSIGNNFFIMLADLLKIKDKFKLSIEELLLLFANFNTTFSYEGDVSLYNKLFQNPAYSRPVLAALSSTNSNPTAFNSELSKNEIIPLFRSLFRLTEADFNLIISSESLSSQNITPVTISRIFRINLFIKSIGLKVKEYYQLVTPGQLGQENYESMPVSYYDNTVFTFVTPEKTLNFIETYSSIQASGFSVGDLIWLLCNQAADDSDLSINNDDLNTEVLKIGQVLVKIVEECKVNLNGFRNFVKDDFSNFLAMSYNDIDYETIIKHIMDFFDLKDDKNISELLTFTEQSYLTAYFGSSKFDHYNLTGNDYYHLAAYQNQLYLTDKYARYKYILLSRNLPLCDLNAKNIEKYLSFYLKQNDIKEAMALISGDVFSNWDELLEPEKEVLSSKMENLIDAWLKSFLTQHAYNDEAISLAIVNAKAYLIKDFDGEYYLDKQTDRYIFIINDLMLACIKKYVITEISSFLGIDECLTKLMLEKYLVFSISGTKNSQQVFFDSTFVESIKTEVSNTNIYDNHKKVLLRLYKAALFIKKYSIDSTTAGILFDHSNSNDMNCLNIYDLPYESNNNSTLNSWLAFDKYFELNNSYFNKKSLASNLSVNKTQPGIFELIDNLNFTTEIAQSSVVSSAESAQTTPISTTNSIKNTVDNSTDSEQINSGNTVSDSPNSTGWNFDKYVEQTKKYTDKKPSTITPISLVRTKSSLFEIIDDLCATAYSEQTKIDAAIAEIAESTGWNIDDITFLCKTMKGNSYNNGNATLRNLLISCDWLNELVEQLKLVHLFRISASAIVDINVLSPDSVNKVNNYLRQILKEKYGIHQWLKIYTPTSNILREKLRDALVAYLTGHNNEIGANNFVKFKDAISIYDYFLIDPLVGVEPLTSRILQAGLTVQLFIQRILMKLEGNLSIDVRHLEEWKWRKNYRVWEANRKVFLFPENWLEPELRMDKSYFFKEMESALLQDEITKENVEQAYLAYLDKMLETSNFEIAGSYLDKGDGENDLHVIARTKTHPHVYYYRKYEEMKYWKPWEKMDIEIDGDHILPIVWNRQLYVFWLKFTPGNTSIPMAKFSDSLTQAKSNLKINLAWSNYQNHKWNGVNISKEDYVLTDEAYQLWSIGRINDLIFTPYNDNIKDISNNTVFNSNPAPDCLPFAIYVDIIDQCWPLLIVEFYRDAVANFKRVDFLLYNSLNTNGTNNPRYLNDCYSVSVGKNRRDERKGIIFHSIFNNKFYTDYQDYYKFDKVDNNEWFYKYINPINDADYPNMLYYQEIRKVSKDALPFPPSGIPAGTIIPGKGDGQHLLPGQMIHGKGDGGILPGKGNPIKNKDNPEDNTHGLKKYLPEKTTNKKMILGKLSKPTFISFANNDFICSMKSINKDQTNIKQFNNLKHLFIETDGKIFFGKVTDFSTGLININQNEPIGGLLMSGGGNINPNGQLNQIPSENLPFNNNKLIIGNVSEDRDGPIGGGGLPFATFKRQYWFQTFYHPFIPVLIKQLRKYGIDGLLDPDYTQFPALCRQTLDSGFDFNSEFNPSPDNVALGTYQPKEDIDFSPEGPYSIYNWELFFHAPLTIADRLSQNRKFADAQKWYHYIFDPTDTNPNFVGNARFWKIKPFALLTDLRDMQDLMYEMSKTHNALETQIQLWRNDPFNPHLIAQFRHLAYMKSVVMKYLDNLIAWGDSLFTQDTMESINEAVQIYMLAAHILGRRLVIIEKQESASQSFNDIKDHLDEFSNAIVNIENYIAVSKKENTFNNRTETEYVNGVPQETTTNKKILPNITAAENILSGRKKTSNGTGFILATVYKSLYFGVPFNDKLLTYWDNLEDRLFKIRHSLNIKGIKRNLALYAPPIDPGLLIKAKAAGLDITQALDALNSPLPHYRFRVILQKAQELCNDIKGFGSILLSALEKKDAESIALTRAVQEKSLLSAVKSIKLKAIEEAQSNIEATNQSLVNAGKRNEIYQLRIKNGCNTKESTQLKRLEQAMIFQANAQNIQALVGFLGLIPNFTISVGTDTSSKSTWGGQNLAQGFSGTASVLSFYASILQHYATKASIMGGYERRNEEWSLQADMASWEMEQINKQLIAAQIRLEIAKKDAENHELQMKHSDDNFEFMKSKYTNEELYNWMITQTSTLYFDMYQYAVRLAKQAERCMLFELGINAAEHTDIITYGHWDNLKKGLFAGDKLQNELRLLENYYMENNERLFEITKNISLSMLNADALMELRTNGVCEFEIPEMLYDMDYPGTYMRRIKTVSISIPASTGPYTNISCKLSMLNNRYRSKTSLGSNYAYTGIDDERFVSNIVGIQSIATSTAQNDKGLFEFNFNDERYLPFEGAGAIGRWQIELPENFRQFDYETISDAILHISYTAHDAGGTLKEAAIKNLKDNLNKMMDEMSGESMLLPIDFKATFADELYRLTKTAEGNTTGIDFTITRELFPDFVRDYLKQNNTTKTIKIQKIDLISKSTGSFSLGIAGGVITDVQDTTSFKGFFYKLFDTDYKTSGNVNIFPYAITSNGIDVSFKINEGDINKIENFWVLVNYTIENV